MLLAYIDEIGEPGAFVSRDDARYNTSPAFGYAGFILPEGAARRFGSKFVKQKGNLFRAEIDAAAHPGRWERKGASIFRPTTWEEYPQQVRAFNGLVWNARNLGGCLFYHADEKPIGTPKQTQLNVTDRETAAMREALNRIARYADHHGENVMVIIDQINEKTRAERLPRMYEHILGRASDHPEMRRIVEPPMHVDSVLSANIQFADWVAACVSRAIDYQLIETSPYKWITHASALGGLRGGFTYESKLHLYYRDVDDLNGDRVFHPARPMFPAVTGNRIGGAIDPRALERARAAAIMHQAPSRPSTP